MHLIAPFLSFFRGSIPPTPQHKCQSTSLQGYVCAGYGILSIANQLIVIKTFKNADQMYTYLMKLKINIHIGTFRVTKINAYSLQVQAVEKKTAPPH